MNPDDPNEGDWFPETLPAPCADFLAVLNDPCLVETIAKIRCAHELSPSLRGDNMPPGHSIVTNGLPLVFAVTVSHLQTRFLAELAGIAPAKKTRGVKYTPPCEKEIARAMKNIRAALEIRLRKAAETLRGEAKQ